MDAGATKVAPESLFKKACVTKANVPPGHRGNLGLSVPNHAVQDFENDQENVYLEKLA